MKLGFFKTSQLTQGTDQGEVWEKNFEHKKGREQHDSSFQIFVTTFPIT